MFRRARHKLARRLSRPAPLRSAAPLEAARDLLRSQVPALDEDRHFHPDMESANALVRSGQVIASVGQVLPGVR